MYFFDLHCDTLTECFKTGQELFTNTLAVSFDKAKCIERWCQTFAIFIPDTKRGEHAVKYYNSILDLFYHQLSINNSIASLCSSAKEVECCVNANKYAALLSVESCAALGGDINNLYKFHADGVSLMTLTWNGDNEVASGVYGSRGPLTDFGKLVVKTMNELGIIIDVSHLNEHGFWQVMELSMAPVVATHSNFKSIKDHPRNLTDEQFIAICRSGGTVGINFYRDFLGDNGFNDVMRHLYHALELGGEDNISFGSDFDGCDIDNTLNSIDKMYNLCDYLIRYGFCESLLNKLFFDNALNLLKSKELKTCYTTAQEIML